MRLVEGNAIELLAGLAPEVVLVDPMHPPRGNTALVKQEMRQLRELVGADPDALALLQAALAAASRRVVLKWPAHAAPLVGLRPPSHSIAGKSTRYDVFMTG
jgi:16S rRNA (guanine1516-N2)-methyltransferase